MDIFLTVAEWIGTVALAASGSLKGVQKNLDLFGVLLLSVVTAMGGGVLRDILLGTFPPKMFFSGGYVIACLAVTIVIFLAARLFHCVPRFGVWGDKAFNCCDAVGLGIFVVIGVQAAVQTGNGENLFLSIFMGTVTGVGGGVLRDMMCGEIPAVLRKHIYAVAAIVGSLLYYCSEQLFNSPTTAATVGIGCTVLIRILASRYRWNLPRALGRNAPTTELATTPPPGSNVPEPISVTNSVPVPGAAAAQAIHPEGEPNAKVPDGAAAQKFADVR